MAEGERDSSYCGAGSAGIKDVGVTDVFGMWGAWGASRWRFTVQIQRKVYPEGHQAQVFALLLASTNTPDRGTGGGLEQDFPENSTKLSDVWWE